MLSAAAPCSTGVARYEPGENRAQAHYRHCRPYEDPLQLVVEPQDRREEFIGRGAELQREDNRHEDEDHVGKRHPEISSLVGSAEVYEDSPDVSLQIARDAKSQGQGD